MESSKRRFFTSEVLRKAFKLAAEVQEAYQEGQSASDYFESFESCYPLISEYAYFIEDEIKSLGIDTEGMNSKEITQMVYDINQRKNSKV